MKYPRGTVLRWTAKALSSSRAGSSQRNSEQRMVVVDATTVILYSGSRIEDPAMHKSQDSYVEKSGQKTPSKLAAILADETEYKKLCRLHGYVTN